MGDYETLKNKVSKEASDLKTKLKTDLEKLEKERAKADPDEKTIKELEDKINEKKNDLKEKLSREIQGKITVLEEERKRSGFSEKSKEYFKGKNIESMEEDIKKLRNEVDLIQLDIKGVDGEIEKIRVSA